MSNDYQPIIYIWIEVPNPPGTRGQFMLAKYLGGDVRAGALEVRSHIWLSDNDVITFREYLPHTMNNTPSVVKAYAAAVQERILDHVAKVLRDRNDTHEANRRGMDEILDEVNG